MLYTIRCSIFTCAQKLTRWQPNVVHGTETKNKEKQKPSSSEEMVWAIVCEGRSETMGGGFVKEVHFKLGVKERKL